MSGTSNYRTDALRMTNSTDIAEIKNFLRRRIRSPYHAGSKIVWNFSNHTIEEEALMEGLNGKLERDKYVIPYQVTGTWAMQFSLLPETIQNSEILVYKTNYSEYSAYSNFLRDMGNSASEFKQEMEEELEQMGIVESP